MPIEGGTGLCALVLRQTARGSMISLKKYWDAAHIAPEEAEVPEIDRAGKALCDKDKNALLPVAIAAYQSALREMGACSVEACPALGPGLMKSLAKLDEKLSGEVSRASLEATDKNVQERLQEWGRGTATHYRQKTAEVKDLLLVMARTAESRASWVASTASASLPSIRRHRAWTRS